DANLVRPESMLSGPIVLSSCGPVVLWSRGPVVLWSCVVPLVLPNPCAPVRTNPSPFELQSGTSENRAVRPAAALFVKYATQTLDFRSFQEFSGVNFNL